ncbi:CamS family sex pheromone protein [Halalkalibacterium ligniniphilum]|uniref:CamS family sex pheromone protein n=1 Tax=Halalkalibacterium ligniniphilum TaxID=1134413 RepID=UPI000349D85D|nr:CamS family sex pheromone protein [Halalkalibacterium ligniniphilum]
MMLKKMSILLASSVLFLSGCFPFLQQREEEMVEVEESNQEDQTVQVVPQVSNHEDYYQSVLYDGSYLHGQSRGFGNSVVYNRLDLDQLELGLASIAQDYFEPNRYFFREGQYIERDELNSWLMRYNDETNPTGLNPALGEGETMREREENRPRYLSHILEHNYLVENEEGNLVLGGVVIGLSMNSVYNFRVEDEQGRYYFYETPISAEDMQREGERIAQEIVTRLRADTNEEGGIGNVPVVVALFREQPRESMIPGNFFAKAIAESGIELSRWERVNERYYLFPSNEANQDVRNDAEKFLRLKEEIQGFFNTYVGVVGRAYYKDNQLQKLTIEVPIRYQGKAEIVALTQFIADKITQRFPEQLKVQVYVSSVAGKQESIIIRNPNEEPFIHVYD